MFAIVLQAMLPLVHHPAGMALAGYSGDIRNLCLAPGSVPAPADNPDKAPAHHLPACALCQAVQALGGFAPPLTAALDVLRSYAPVFHDPASQSAPQRLTYARQRARAPPFLA